MHAYSNMAPEHFYFVTPVIAMMVLNGSMPGIIFLVLKMWIDGVYSCGINGGTCYPFFASNTSIGKCTIVHMMPFCPDGSTTV